MSEQTPDTAEMLPTYYVTHPDGSFSLAAPQPTAEQVRKQWQSDQFEYALCDHRHKGDPCNDPRCYLIDAAARLERAGPEILSALKAIEARLLKCFVSGHKITANEILESVQQARAAINRAEGETT